MDCHQRRHLQLPTSMSVMRGFHITDSVVTGPWPAGLGLEGQVLGPGLGLEA